MSWGVLDGLLTAESGRFGELRYDVTCWRALNLVYHIATRYLNEEDRLEFDGHCTVTAKMMAEYENEQREHRLKLVMSLGEVEGVSDDGRTE